VHTTVTVIPHLPQRRVRHLRNNLSTLVTDFGLRVFEAISRGKCTPTVRSVVAYYRDARGKCSKDLAQKALKSLEKAGLLRRWRRSAGKNSFVHFAVVTDEHFAWDHDATLMARISKVETETVARAREALAEDEVAYPELPMAPEVTAPETSQSGSCPGSQDVTDKSTSMLKKDLSGSPVHNRYERRLMSLMRVPAHLETHMFPAMELLHGLEVKSPLDRAFYGRSIAEFLAGGGTLGAMTEFLTVGMETARSRRAVLRHRLERLRASLGVSRASKGASGTPGPLQDAAGF
jgi:hypothetical protein